MGYKKNSVAQLRHVRHRFPGYMETISSTFAGIFILACLFVLFYFYWEMKDQSRVK